MSLPADYFHDFNRQFGEATDWQGRRAATAHEPHLRMVFGRGRDKFSELIAYDVVRELGACIEHDVLALSLEGRGGETALEVSIACDCGCLRDLFADRGVLPLLTGRHRLHDIEVVLPAEGGAPGQTWRLAA